MLLQQFMTFIFPVPRDTAVVTFSWFPLSRPFSTAFLAAPMVATLTATLTTVDTHGLIVVGFSGVFRFCGLATVPFIADQNDQYFRVDGVRATWAAQTNSGSWSKAAGIS